MKTHSGKGTREYALWVNLRYRHKEKMSAAWRDSFDAFLSDMGPRPPGHRLVTKDNKLYSKDTCVWSRVKGPRPKSKNPQPPPQDLTGQTFGAWTVLHRAKVSATRSGWRCRCCCGLEQNVVTHDLTSGHTRSCGCMASALISHALQQKEGDILPGQQYGRLTVLDRAENRHLQRRWRCRCVCGNETTVYASQLRNEQTRSCGCWAAEVWAALPEENRTHGMSRTHEYGTWLYLKYTYAKDEVCLSWRESFEAFLADMGPCPEDHQILRLNRWMPYSKENCTWQSTTGNPKPAPRTLAVK
jgi:hypothetical protein